MITEKEQFDNACGCGSYVGFNGDVESGDFEYQDFDGDVESDEFDEFIGKKRKRNTMNNNSGGVRANTTNSKAGGLFGKQGKKRSVRAIYAELIMQGYPKGDDTMAQARSIWEQENPSSGSGVSSIKKKLSFDGEVESDEFDEFIGKKARERRAVKKELMAQGVSRKDARQQAREKVGGKNLGEIISGVKEKIEGIQGAMDGAVGGSAEGEVAQRSANTDTVDSRLDVSIETGSESPAWQKYALWGGIGLVVIIGGFFAYRHFSKGKK